MRQERDNIREVVFTRDSNKCVVPWCQHKPDDAHHLIERKLWDESGENGGYILNNLVSVCEPHHKLCENNTILPQTLREWVGIQDVVLPKTFDKTKQYDKWGKELKLPNRDSIKYPHTPYLPFSPNADEKDVDESGYMETPNLLNKPLAITLKMDGSNVVMTNNHIAARNGYDATHVSFDMVKQIHAQVKSHIPEGLMVFGEWLYAKHSIHYIDGLTLKHPFQIFGAYNCTTHMWSGLADVIRLCDTITVGSGTDQISVVDGVPDYNNLDALKNNKTFTTEKDLRSTLIRLGNKAVSMGHEGIVVRNAYAFHHGRWNQNIAKFVRSNHVQTDEHWSQQPVIRNQFLK
jgi:hypothetical protein